MKTRKRGSGRPSQKKVDPAGNNAGAGLGRDVQTKIGQQLRAMYDDVVNQGVPDRFAELLNQLEINTSKGKR